MEINYRADLYKIIDIKLPAAEIGVAEGNFSCDMLAWGIPLLYSVDTWQTINGQFGDGGFDQQWHDQNYAKASFRLQKFGARSKILRGFSADMAKQVPDNSLGIIHLDGDHSYEGVMSDLNSWFPKVVSGGVISGHDYKMTHYGVQRAVTEFTRAKGIDRVYVMHENKPEDAGFYFIKP